MRNSRIKDKSLCYQVFSFLKISGKSDSFIPVIGILETFKIILTNQKRDMPTNKPIRDLFPF